MKFNPTDMKHIFKKGQKIEPIDDTGFISYMVKATINGEKHLGENLKRRCIKYIENLETKVGE